MNTGVSLGRIGQWNQQLDELRHDLGRIDSEITEAEAKIMPLRSERDRLSEQMGMLQKLIDLEKGPTLPGIPASDAPGDAPEIGTRKSPRNVMLQVLAEKKAPMTEDELWEQVRQHLSGVAPVPGKAVYYALYGARTKDGLPIERLNDGRWIWRGT